MILIDTLKKSAYYVNSKYVKIIKFSVTPQKLRASENLSDFQSREDTSPKIQGVLMKTKLSDQTFCQKITEACLIIYIIFYS